MFLYGVLAVDDRPDRITETSEIQVIVLTMPSVSSAKGSGKDSCYDSMQVLPRLNGADVDGLP